MNDRTKLLTLALAGLTLGFPASHWAFAQPVPAPTQPAQSHAGHDGMPKGEKDEAHEAGEKGEHEHGEKGEHEHSEQGEHGEKGEHEHGEQGEHGEKGEHKHGEHGDWHGNAEQEIETAVPLNMVPQPVMDAVKKEVPNGTVTEAELEVKKGKIVYGFDVKDGAMTYDINISVDGKFISKVVDDEADEAGEKSGEAGEKGEADEKGEKD